MVKHRTRGQWGGGCGEAGVRDDMRTLVSWHRTQLWSNLSSYWLPVLGTSQSLTFTILRKLGKM